MANNDVERGSTASSTTDFGKDLLKKNIVTWDGPDDQANPKNWSRGKRWAMTLIVSCFAILPPFATTIISPSANAISADLNITNPVSLEMCLSIFVLGLGIGPVIMGPLSEVYGRVPVLIIGNIFFVLWNTGCGFVASDIQLIVCRFFSGFGSSASLAISGGLNADMWPPEDRGKVMAIATFGPLLGPAVGPIMGGYITQYTSWRWILWGVTIMDVAFLGMALFWLKETYAPRILRQKARRLNLECGSTVWASEYEIEENIFKRLGTNLVRPVRLIGTQSIIQILCMYFIVLYGTMFLVLFTYPDLWTNKYLQSVGDGSLNYISTAVGVTIGAQVAGRLNDAIYVRLKARNNGVGKPEFRTPLMLPGTLLSTVGLLIYGWGGQYVLHWVVPNIGNGLFMAGCIICSQSIQTYTIDAYTRYAASAVSTLNLVRHVAGFAFPLFAPYIYNALDWGWSNTVFALIIGVIGTAAPLLLWFCGVWLRARNTYAAGD